jgi:hypothetical protein
MKTRQAAMTAPVGPGSTDSAAAGAALAAGAGTGAVAETGPGVTTGRDAGVAVSDEVRCGEDANGGGETDTRGAATA